MSSKMNRLALLAGVIGLISACATTPPSLPAGQFVVIVKGEAAPLKSFDDFVQRQMANRMLPGCEAKIPARSGEGATASGIGVDQLVYECASAPQASGAELFEVFSRAYRSNPGGLLEMRVTTASCVARTCFGGALRYWQLNAVCLVLC